MQLAAKTIICSALLSSCILQKVFSFRAPTTPTKISTKRWPHFHSPPLYEVEIDYSAANEYVQAHYGENAPSKPYFRQCVTDQSSDSSKVVEPIYDARKGVYDRNSMAYRTASLPLCGFSLRNLPSNVTDWSNIDQIKHQYVKELEAVIPSAFPDNQLKHITFWNPMLRGKNYTIQRNEDSSTISTSNIASTVHIDTDIGAFESFEEVVSMVENNRVKGTKFRRADIIDSISTGHRFAIVNFWRNINPTPVMRTPLAVLYTKYPSSTKSTRRRSFPHDSPDPICSSWYTYPSMTKDECLLFLQYDRLLSQPSDIWHCALPSVAGGSEVGVSGSGDVQDYGLPRRSFDIRALIVFEEKVSTDLDRFSLDRARPILSLEESGCFCEDQASSRLKASEELTVAYEKDAMKS